MKYENEKLKEFEKYIKNKNVAIIGLGVSNIPLIDYFYEKQAKVTIFDSREKEKIPQDILEKATNYGMKMSFRKRVFVKIK